MPTLTVDKQTTPRIILVDAPDTTISMQELVDLLGDWEDESENSSDDTIYVAEGKADLGGSTTSITLTLQNAVVGFETRDNVIESGTVTTADAVGKYLTDTGATFQTNGVAIGDWVRNITDSSWATVVSVTSETQLVTQRLLGGTDNDYDSSDSYEIYNTVQCAFTGGNLLAVDTNGSTIDAIFPTFGTTVTRNQSTDGVLVNQDTMDTRVRELWQDAGFDVDNPVSIATDGKTITVAGIVRRITQALGIKTISRDP